MRTPVVIVDYDVRWPLLFEAERGRIAAAVGDWVVAIEHIGSTAVPSLGAKPTIDVIVGIRSLDDAERCIAPLLAIGYRYVPGAELVIPERRFFWKGTPAIHTHHLHVVEPGGEFWERQLLFRDFLRTHAEAARQYEQLKRALAARFGTDREGYADAKTAFVQSVLARARAEQAAKP